MRSGRAVASAVATAREYAEQARVLAGTLPATDASAALGSAAHALLDTLAVRRCLTWADSVGRYPSHIPSKETIP